MIPTFLWSVGYVSYIDPLMYRIIWWAMGHSSQQINVAAHIAVWYAVAAIVFGAKPLSEKVSRMAFLLYILFLQLASAHHLLADPGISSEWKIFNTSYAMYLAVLASMIHGLTVPGSMEAAQRSRGFNKGLFEWLRKAPWGNPTFAGVFLSILIFGFLGGISGVTMGVEQINLIVHNTLYVPGHFHATVVGGTTLAFMALTYWLVPVLFRRDIILNGLSKFQPYLFGLGTAGLSLFMMGAGTLGVPRRHWDISFADALLKHAYPETAYLMLALAGLSAILATVGGGLFILQIVGTVLFGRKKGAQGEEPGADHRAADIGRSARPRRRRRGRTRYAGHGARVPDHLHPVLLRELEVSVRGLAVEVAAPGAADAGHRADRVVGRPDRRKPARPFPFRTG